MQASSESKIARPVLAPQRVLVTGASGFLGSWLTRALIADGHQVTVLLRPTSDRSELAGLNLQEAPGDVTNLESLVAACRGTDSVFHFAGHIGYRPAERKLMELVNVQGTANVLEAVRKNQIPSLVYASSVVAIGASRTGEQPLTEDSPFTIKELNLGYFDTKHRAEKLVQEEARNAAHENRKFRAVIVNPSTVYGPGDARKSSRSTQIKVARGELPFFTGGGVNVVPVENLIDGVLRAWALARSGERYILAGENFTIQQLLSEIAHAAGVEPPRIRLPDFALHTLGAIGDQLTRVGIPLKFSSENAWTATLFHWFDSGRAQRELGFEPGSARDAIRASVDWSRSHGLLNKSQ